MNAQSPSSNTTKASVGNGKRTPVRHFLLKLCTHGSVAVLALLLFQALRPDTLPSKVSAHVAPAKVPTKLKESDLATITMLPEAELRLGIETANVDESPMPRLRLYGGEVVVPDGRSASVSAPLTGRLVARGEARAVPGASVSRGQPVFHLWPVLGSDTEVLSPGDRFARLRANMDIEAAAAEVEGQVAKAKVDVDAAQLRVTRAKGLYEADSGSSKAYEAAGAEMKSAEAALDAAQRRLAIFRAGPLDPTTAEVPALAIQSPLNGTLQRVFVADDQIVTAGTPLFSVVDLSAVWIRVPIYVGELESIQGNVATISTPGAAITPLQANATRVHGPPSANNLAATVDIFYELPNPGAALCPGQRVLVTIAADDTTPRLTVPASAIVHDVHGGQWLYERVQPQAYARRRVELERVDQTTAILRHGIRPGAAVVAAGAAELYGIEFGVGK